MKTLSILICATVILLLADCKKNSTDPNNNNNGNGNSNTSAADKIVGTYTGTGKYLPGNINLGNTIICSTPATDYNTLYQVGTASVNISKLTDSTVKIVLLSGPFPQDTYNSVLLKVIGNTIEFHDSLSISSRFAGLIARVETGSGYFDPATNTVAFSRSAPNFSYSFSTTCYAGLPYYASFPVPDASTGLMVYANYTNKRYVFSGNK